MSDEDTVEHTSDDTDSAPDDNDNDITSNDSNVDSDPELEQINEATEPIKSDSITFNKNLATKHTYLGDDLEELRGCTVLPDSEKLVIPILLNEVVLFPWKALPLSFEGDEIAFIENHLKTSNAIVIAAPMFSKHNYNSYTVEFGCTAEIHNKTYNCIHEELTVTTLGRQRVRVIHNLAPNTLPVSYRFQLGVVQALPDNQLQSIPPYIYTCSEYHVRSALCASTFVRTNYSELSKEEMNNILKPFRRFKRSGTMLSVHRWILRRFEEDELMDHAKSLFIEKLGPLPCEMPLEFIPFTYKFAGSLPFTNEILLEILKIDSPHQRLRYILECLSHTSELDCIRCRANITLSKFIFSMSQDGPLANYINPHGYVHDTLTVSKISNVVFVGGAKSEHSWFPGYKWTIMNCGHCRSHLGWKFQATKMELVPKLFYGLTRRALKWDVTSQ